MEILPVGADLLHADRRTDMTKPIVSFSQSSKWTLKVPELPINIPQGSASSPIRVFPLRNETVQRKWSSPMITFKVR